MEENSLRTASESQAYLLQHKICASSKVEKICPCSSMAYESDTITKYTIESLLLPAPSSLTKFHIQNKNGRRCCCMLCKCFEKWPVLLPSEIFGLWLRKWVAKIDMIARRPVQLNTLSIIGGPIREPCNSWFPSASEIRTGTPLPIVYRSYIAQNYLNNFCATEMSTAINFIIFGNRFVWIYANKENAHLYSLCTAIFTSPK